MQGDCPRCLEPRGHLIAYVNTSWTYMLLHFIVFLSVVYIVPFNPQLYEARAVISILEREIELREN